jgi:hypothetical protein
MRAEETRSGQISVRFCVGIHAPVIRALKTSREDLMLACLLLALSFGTIAALQLVAMNYLHNLDPMHSPYDMDQRPYRGGEIAVGGMVWSLGASVAATVMWAVGVVLADGYAFALCTVILLNVFVLYQSLEYFWAAINWKFFKRR